MTTVCEIKKPIVKWAGGKTQLLDALMARIPEKYNRYFEPFIGGGALFLALSPQVAVINDTNEQLINLYSQIKNSNAEIINIVNKLDAVQCDKNFYLSNRCEYNEKIKKHELDASCAALMIWLNKHCFNGLYRVNNNGYFNVPYNNKVSVKSIDENNIKSIGEYLRNADVEIYNKDFEDVCSSVCQGDFVYFDSPYIPLSETACFTEYTKEGFTLADHKRLAALFRRLDSVGAKIMLSNNDAPLVWELYNGYNIQSVEAQRMINCNSSKRTGREVIITNY